MNSYIEFDEHNGWLLCPHCRGFNLHHDKVTIYERKLEDAPPTAFLIEGPAVLIDAVNNGAGNPSSRRNGVVIQFWVRRLRRLCPTDNSATQRRHSRHVATSSSYSRSFRAGR